MLDNIMKRRDDPFPLFRHGHGHAHHVENVRLTRLPVPFSLMGFCGERDCLFQRNGHDCISKWLPQGKRGAPVKRVKWIKVQSRLPAPVSLVFRQ
jgi:hypothetical protein